MAKFSKNKDNDWRNGMELNKIWFLLHPITVG